MIQRIKNLWGWSAISPKPSEAALEARRILEPLNELFGHMEQASIVPYKKRDPIKEITESE